MYNYLPFGSIKQYAQKLKKTNMFSLEDWAKKLLDYLHIPSYDECCPTDPKPIRFNDNTLEQYNGTTWTEIDLCSICPTPPPPEKYFGSFYSMQNQTGLNGATLSMQCEVSDPWNNGVFLDSLINYRIASPGVYNIAFSGQFIKQSGNSSTHIHIWLSQNGNDVPNSNSQISFPSNSTYIVAAWNFFFETTAPNEYVTLKWKINSNVDNGVLLHKDTTLTPSIPSLIVTINQVN